ncbi:MFS general substrate transporter [Coniophora puteana RWD-64-598 SS2]|uniref:MFS general substrate transporter n=1 Tax=Coniophora puteana (strain RWD-64-598) TaxID=741705 RepID=A0A5M3MH67_CONPW|nr:MFS general substrate transporter [Coniophora puteana RWD-64-598 SS2]EIW78578.1 MFS general substrate transporter [Coniophora puteana RWD-64-598 SS2]
MLEKAQIEQTEDKDSILKIEPEEEKRLVRKLDLRILPITCFLYLLAYLDRSNLGNARLQGLPADVLGGDPTGLLFEWVNSAFFFSYIIFQVPATVVSKLFPPSYWMAVAAAGWGICSTLASTAFNFGGLITVRVGLGVFEAAFGPSIPLYYSFFYTRNEMGLRLAYWFGFAAVAGAFGGLIAYGVQQAEVPIENWRLLFIIEGIPAVLLGLLAAFALPNRPEATNFFNERERVIALERMNRGTRADTGAVINKGHIIKALKDWRIYTCGIIYFGVNCALGSLGGFLPTIIASFGYTNARAQLLTVPPYAVAAVFLTGISWFTDRLQSRGLTVAGSCGLGALGYLLLVVSLNDHVRYFAVFCITTGTYTSIGIIIAWFAHNLGSETKKAAGIPMFMAIGQGGSILGSHIYPTTDAPRYILGNAVCCGLEGLAMILSIVLYLSFRMENNRRNRKYGVPNPDDPVDTAELADKAPMFRYIP